MIKKFINDSIADFVNHSKSCRDKSLSPLQKFKENKKTFEYFFNDLCWKWIASRSQITVNKLLDAGLGADAEDKARRHIETNIQNFLEIELKKFFKKYAKKFFAVLCISFLIILTVVGIAIFKRNTNIYSWYSVGLFCIGIFSFTWACLLYLSQRKHMSVQFGLFLSNLFQNAESIWLEQEISFTENIAGEQK